MAKVLEQKKAALSSMDAERDDLQAAVDEYRQRREQIESDIAQAAVSKKKVMGKNCTGHSGAPVQGNLMLIAIFRPSAIWPFSSSGGAFTTSSSAVRIVADRALAQKVWPSARLVPDKTWSIWRLLPTGWVANTRISRRSSTRYASPFWNRPTNELSALLLLLV